MKTMENSIWANTLEIQNKTATLQEITTAEKTQKQDDIKDIRIFDIYSGTGAIKTVLKKITRNLHITGEVVAMCKNNQDMKMRLQYNNPQTTMINDATDINWNEVPQFNVLTASPPCQDWSTAGRGLGERGWNGGTTPAILHIMEKGNH